MQSLLCCAVPPADMLDALPLSVSEALVAAGRQLPEGWGAAVGRFHFTALPMQLHAVSAGVLGWAVRKSAGYALWVDVGG